MKPTHGPFRTAEHGNRARYVQGCRCDSCREANRLYARKNAKDRIWNRTDPMLSAEASRTHLTALRAAGVGTRLISDLSGVSRTVIARVLSGAQAVVRRSVEARLLEVSADARELTDALLVDARPTWRLLRKLLALGYTRTELARRLGSRSKTPALQVREDLVTNATRVKVEKLHAAIMKERKEAEQKEAENAVPAIDWRPADGWWRGAHRTPGDWAAP